MPKTKTACTKATLRNAGNRPGILETPNKEQEVKRFICKIRGHHLVVSRIYLAHRTPTKVFCSRCGYEHGYSPSGDLRELVAA